MRETNTIKESEMISLRLIHCFIWIFWNMEIAKPLLKWLYLVDKINPLDAVLAIIDNKNNSKQAQVFICEFQEEAKSEWFETSELLKEHYSAAFDDLLKSGFKKLNFKYMAKCLLSETFTRTLLACIVEKANDKVVAKEMVEYCISRVYFPYDTGSQQISEIVISESLSSALKIIGAKYSLVAGRYQVQISPRSIHLINSQLTRFSGVEKERALELALESVSAKFIRQVKTYDKVK